METVSYETKHATFYFDVPEVLNILKYIADEYNVNEATKLLRSIESSSSKFIKISSHYFGFVVLALLDKGKGSVFCKSCQNTYLPSQLCSIPVGFGKSPFTVNLKKEGGIIRRFFARKKLISGRGGTAYKCPKGHELISAITWVGTLKIPK